VAQPLVVEVVGADDARVRGGADGEVEPLVRPEQRVVRLVVATPGEIGDDVLDPPLAVEAEERVGVADVERAVVPAGAGHRARLRPALLRQLKEDVHLAGLDVDAHDART
jgi:hypothetical protein